MNYHDPLRATELLRNHLAAHDQSLCFLFGAGTSAINIADNDDTTKPIEYTPLIPTVSVLTDICKKNCSDLGKKFAVAWEKIINECKDLDQDPNIENMKGQTALIIATEFRRIRS